MHEHDSFEPGEDVLYKPLGDAVVLLDVAKQKFFELDGVGSRVWSLVVEHGNVRDVVSHLCSEYEANSDVVTSDVIAVIDGLYASGLLRLTSRDAA